jgi:hypothetical protein
MTVANLNRLIMVTPRTLCSHTYTRVAKFSVVFLILLSLFNSPLLDLINSLSLIDVRNPYYKRNDNNNSKARQVSTNINAILGLIRYTNRL